MAAQQVSFSDALGKALFTAWNFSSQKAATVSLFASIKFEEGKNSNAIPLINSFTTRCYCILPRLITPYPFESVSSIVDFIISETIRQTRFDQTVHSKPIAAILKMKCYADAYKKFKTEFQTKTMQWRLQIIKERKGRSAQDCALLEAMASALDTPFESHWDGVLKPHFDTIFCLTKGLCEPKKLIEQSQFTLGKLLMNPDLRRYQNYLLSLIETSVRILAASERAMRYLGRDLCRDGLDKLHNAAQDAVKMVCVHATLREVISQQLIPVYGEVRGIKLDSARALLRSFTESDETPRNFVESETLRILAILEIRKGRKHLEIHLDELSDDLFLDEGILTMQYFDVCSPGKPTGSACQFQQAYALGLPADSS